MRTSILWISFFLCASLNAGVFDDCERRHPEPLQNNLICTAQRDRTEMAREGLREDIAKFEKAVRLRGDDELLANLKSPDRNVRTEAASIRKSEVIYYLSKLKENKAALNELDHAPKQFETRTVVVLSDRDSIKLRRFVFQLDKNEFSHRPYFIIRQCPFDEKNCRLEFVGTNPFVTADENIVIPFSQRSNTSEGEQRMITFSFETEAEPKVGIDMRLKHPQMYLQAYFFPQTKLPPQAAADRGWEDSAEGKEALKYQRALPLVRRATFTDPAVDDQMILGQATTYSKSALGWLIDLSPYDSARVGHFFRRKIDAGDRIVSAKKGHEGEFVSSNFLRAVFWDPLITDDKQPHFQLFIDEKHADLVASKDDFDYQLTLQGEPAKDAIYSFSLVDPSSELDFTFPIQSGPGSKKPMVRIRVSQNEDEPYFVVKFNVKERR